LQSNLVLADAMSASLQENGIPADALQMVRSTGHEAVEAMLQMDQYIDVLIPRGGKGLIQAVAAGTRIPVIKHYEGICHLYIAADAPEDMAVRVAVNSKVQRVEVCNALETLLVDQAAADRLLPPLLQAFQEKNVELRGCERTRTLVPALKAAVEEDWRTEYLAPVLSVRWWMASRRPSSTSTPMDLDTQTRSSPRACRWRSVLWLPWIPALCW
jgi:glutamate-5-semialdehyde dehydrogenase